MLRPHLLHQRPFLLSLRPSRLGQTQLSPGWALGYLRAPRMLQAPSYALGWPFPDPVLLCALDAGSWAPSLERLSWALGTGAGRWAGVLGTAAGSRALQKKVKW